MLRRHVKPNLGFLELLYSVDCDCIGLESLKSARDHHEGGEVVTWHFGRTKSWSISDQLARTTE